MVAVAPPLLKQFVFWGERFVGNEAVFSTPLYLLVGNDFYSKIIGKFVETIYIYTSIIERFQETSWIRSLNKN